MDIDGSDTAVVSFAACENTTISIIIEYGCTNWIVFGCSWCRRACNTWLTTVGTTLSEAKVDTDFEIWYQKF